MMKSQRKFQAGFSVVELMIAMLLSMALAGGIISVFVNNSYSFQQDENIGRMQDDARHALREIAFDLSMAGHYADLHVPSTVSYDGDLTIGQDCGPAGEANWMYRATEAGTGNSLSLMAIDNATNASVSAAHSCFLGGELQDGTDVVSIKRVAGAEANVLSATAHTCVPTERSAFCSVVSLHCAAVAVAATSCGLGIPAEHLLHTPVCQCAGRQYSDTLPQGTSRRRTRHDDRVPRDRHRKPADRIRHRHDADGHPTSELPILRSRRCKVSSAHASS